MPDSVPHPEPPTFYTNVVTVHVTLDEVSLEGRRYMPGHEEIWRVSKGGKEPGPVPDDATVYREAPIVKVVMTFTAAKALRDTLQALLPQMETVRKQAP